MTGLSGLTVLDPAFLVICFLHRVHALVGDCIEAVRGRLRRLGIAVAEIDRGLVLAEEPDLVPLDLLELARDCLVAVNVRALEYDDELVAADAVEAGSRMARRDDPAA